MLTLTAQINALKLTLMSYAYMGSLILNVDALFIYFCLFYTNLVIA